MGSYVRDMSATAAELILEPNLSLAHAFHELLFILIFCNHVLIFDCCIHSKLIPHKDAKGETVMDRQFPIARPNDGPCDLTNLI